MKLTPMKFDFTNFTARVAELNRLHKLVHELSDVRWRTGKAEDITCWENSVRAWKEFSGFGEVIREKSQKCISKIFF